MKTFLSNRLVDDEGMKVKTTVSERKHQEYRDVKSRVSEYAEYSRVLRSLGMGGLPTDRLPQNKEQLIGGLHKIKAGLLLQSEGVDDVIEGVEGTPYSQIGDLVTAMLDHQDAYIVAEDEEGNEGVDVQENVDAQGSENRPGSDAMEKSVQGTEAEVASFSTAAGGIPAGEGRKRLRRVQVSGGAGEAGGGIGEAHVPKKRARSERPKNLARFTNKHEETLHPVNLQSHPTMYGCPNDCGVESAGSIETMRRHIRETHTKVPLRCILCNFEAWSEKKVFSHLVEVHSNLLSDIPVIIVEATSGGSGAAKDASVEEGAQSVVTDKME